MEFVQGQQEYEELFGETTRVFSPELQVFRKLGIETYYVTQPLFVLPNKTRQEKFSHPFVSEPLPPQETILSLNERVVGYAFSDATLTHVDPLFVSPFGKERIPVLTLNRSAIEYKTLKERIEAETRLLKFYKKRTKKSSHDHFQEYDQEKKALEVKLRDEERKIKEMVNGDSVRLSLLTSTPLVTNQLRGGIEKIPLLDTMYFIIETETALREKAPNIYMTKSLYVNSAVANPLFDKQINIINDQKFPIERTLVRKVRDENGTDLILHPFWSRGKLFQYDKSLLATNIMGTFVLDGRFIPINGEQEEGIYEFPIYIAYSFKNGQTSLVWKSPETNRLTPITILVASKMTSQRIQDLNGGSKRNWTDTFLLGSESLGQVLLSQVKKNENENEDFTSISDELIDKTNFYKTSILLPHFGVEHSQGNPSPLLTFLDSIRKTTRKKYTENRDQTEEIQEGYGFSLDEVRIDDIYSYETIVLMYEELMASNFFKVILNRHQVLTDKRLLDAYNSYKIEAIPIAKLETDKTKEKHFSNGTETFSTKQLNVTRLFEKGEMYFLVMKNKAALILVRKVSPAGIVLEAGDQVQILNHVEYDHGTVYEIAKNDKFFDFPNGAILIDPHFKWSGEFAFVSQESFQKAKSLLSQEKAVLTAENLLKAIDDARKKTSDNFRFAVVQEIYHARFFMNTPSETLGRLKGGLRSRLNQTLNELGQ